ncbi:MULTISPECIES: hypothetical protein [unclassified Anaerobiospirillum]|uniref:hypothetical protein n=1 Tax=unclassified Anaerobiospirillum TaxID=2647410 RepID=UPI001FF5C97F|nr:MULTISPECIES: hypothetical protein [unclassified Anaerobiospirillum]MCK0534347.1 hypothetical protein [Anaerobiospirillum sp. NML120511]MCK0539667.1 hypothetical protein [Anaerobiospirillum sp. NML02-A-032]
MDSAPTGSKKVIPLGDISHTGFSIAVIKIREGTAAELESILASKIDGSMGTWRNSPVVLNVEDVGNLNSFDFLTLQSVCREHELFLIGVTGVVNEDRAESLTRRRIPVVNSSRYNRIRESNLKPRIITQFIEVKVPVPIIKPYEVQVPYEVKVPGPVKIIRRNVRSGESISAQNSSIAIYGSLGSHARIIASHHIFVFGNVNEADLFAGAPMDDDDPGMADSLIHVQGNFNPGVVAIAGNYSSGEDLYNDPLLTAVRNKNRGVVISLDDTNLKYQSVID